MDLLNVAKSPESPRIEPGWALFALGFRPFFLFAGLSSVVLMLVWIAAWRGMLSAPAHFDPISWHAHEMLFGYTAAVFAGFLLTAVRNWTGVDTWSGSRLGGLALLWLLGRLLPWFDGLPSGLLIAIDVAFLPLLAFSLYGALWHGQNRANRLFLPLLLSMAAVNLLSHLQMLGVVEGLGDLRRVMLELVLLLLVWVAGRVLPFFTRNVIPGFQPTTRPWVEKATFVLIIAIGALELAAPLLPTQLVAGTWLLFGALQLVRLSGWSSHSVINMPVLWILHAGFAWLGIGALMTGLAGFGLFPPAHALHALTMGGVGVFTLGMMARVTRGHTGRSINVDWMTAGAFILLNLGVVVRVFAPILAPAGYVHWVELSAGFWVLAFVLFLSTHAWMLMRTRSDGKPG